MISMRRAAFAALFSGTLLAMLPAAAFGQTSDADWLDDCDDNGNGRVSFCEVRPVAVAATGSLDLRSRNGGIQVCGAEQTDVRLRARVRGWGDTREEAAAQARAVRFTVDGGNVRASGSGTSSDEGWHVDFIGTVPRRYDVEVSAANGPTTVCDLTGRIRIEAQNGPVDLRDVGGEVYARGANGPITLELTGAQVVGSGIDVETRNGPLTLVLPAAMNARLVAGTENGPLSTDFEVDVQRHSRHSVSGEIDATLGQGGGTIRARTSNGPLSVEVGRS